MLTPYQFAGNTPIQTTDLDGLEALYITFPEYKPDPEMDIVFDFEILFFNKRIKGKYSVQPALPLGYAGVLTIEPNEMTRYYEYSRYKDPSKVPGIARKVDLDHNVVMGDDGHPTPESLNIVLHEIACKSGYGGPIRAAYFKTVEVDKILDYAKDRVEDKANENRDPYDLRINSCSTFAEEYLLGGKSIDQPVIFNTSPNNIVDQYI